VKSFRSSFGIEYRASGSRNLEALARQIAIAVVILISLSPANAQQQSRPTATPDGSFNVLRELDNAMAGLSDSVGPSVVQIQVSSYGPREEEDFAAQEFVYQHAIGSGIIVDPNGYIMTNNHVVAGAQRVRVVLPASGRVTPDPEGHHGIYEAEIVGTDPESDLALIKINARALPVIPLDASRKVRQGQLVFAIGSPEALPSTVTMGIVSAVARQVDPKDPMVYIQTDTSINPGNSGGPLVDRDGYVVGINTFIISESKGSAGLGFAIPTARVKFVYDSLRKYGFLRRAAIQALPQAITPSLAQGLRLPQPSGVIVADVTPGGAADSAGLREGDIVQALDNQELSSVPSYYNALYIHPIDEVLKMRVLRDGQPKTISIPVVVHHRDIQQLADLADLKTNMVPRLGIAGLELDERMRTILPGLRSQNGVVVAVLVPDSKDIDTGLRVGDVIYSLNRDHIDSLQNLRKAALALHDRDSVVLQIEREGHLQYLAFDLD
jgi:serine protease Do